VFEGPIEMFADPGDVLITISSSGKSERNLRDVEAGKQVGCGIVPLSGFDPRNPPRGMGELNFYVPCSVCGHVEIMPLALWHCVGDALMVARA